jgi:hypothetical protein
LARQMTAHSSIEAQEWLADYQGRLEAARQEWTANSVARIKARPGPRVYRKSEPRLLPWCPMTHKYEEHRALRRQQFDHALAQLETDLGFRAPPQAPVHRLSQTHHEWLANPVAETHPYLAAHPGVQLALQRHEHRHQRAFQQQLFRHERAMQQRGHQIAIKQVRGEI